MSQSDLLLRRCGTVRYPSFPFASVYIHLSFSDICVSRGRTADGIFVFVPRYSIAFQLIYETIPRLSTPSKITPSTFSDNHRPYTLLQFGGAKEMKVLWTLLQYFERQAFFGSTVRVCQGSLNRNCQPLRCCLSFQPVLSFTIRMACMQIYLSRVSDLCGPSMLSRSSPF